MERISNAISVAKILAMGWIVAVNYYSWLFEGLYKVEYTYALKNFIEVMNKNEFILDKVTYVLSYAGWAGVVVFAIVSGCSLWLSKIKNGFNIKDYTANRVVELYLPYLVAVVVSFIGFTIYNIIYRKADIFVESTVASLMVGAGRFSPNAQVFNSPFWFISLIILLYICYPILPFIYKEFKLKGIAILTGLCFIAYFFIGKYLNVFYPLLPFFQWFCMGIIIIQLIYNRNVKWLCVYLIPLCLMTLVYLLYIEPQSRNEWSINDAYLVGFTACVLFMSIGYLLPMKLNGILRWLSRGTFAVFLYHYLGTRLLPQVLVNIPSITVIYFVLYGVMLLFGSCFQTFIDWNVTQYIKPYFNKKIQQEIT
jgi:hypothetical protein